MSKRFRHISGFLDRDKTLASHLAQIERDQRLLKRVRETLPPPLRLQCLQASIASGRLTLVTSSAAWATPLRFMAPDILGALSPSWPGLRDCRIRVRPTALSAPRTDTARPRCWVSAGTSRQLISAAEGISDPGLAAALRQLAISAQAPRDNATPPERD